MLSCYRPSILTISSSSSALSHDILCSSLRSAPDSGRSTVMSRWVTCCGSEGSHRSGGIREKGVMSIGSLRSTKRPASHLVSYPGQIWVSWLDLRHTHYFLGISRYLQTGHPDRMLLVYRPICCLICKKSRVCATSNLSNSSKQKDGAPAEHLRENP